MGIDTIGRIHVVYRIYDLRSSSTHPLFSTIIGEYQEEGVCVLGTKTTVTLLPDWGFCIEKTSIRYFCFDYGILYAFYGAVWAAAAGGSHAGGGSPAGMGPEFRRERKLALCYGRLWSQCDQTKDAIDWRVNRRDQWQLMNKSGEGQGEVCSDCSCHCTLLNDKALAARNTSFSRVFLLFL